MRVLKKQIEGNTKVKLKCDDVIIQWMIRWAATMVSRYMVGQDGRTSYERRRSRAMQSTSSHVRGESLVQSDPRAEGAQ